MKIVLSGYVDTLTNPQRVAGLIYLPLHIFVIPLLFAIANDVIYGGIDEMTANVLYYALGLIFCLTVMLTYLRKSFDILLDNLGKAVSSVFSAYLISRLLTYAVYLLLLAAFGEEALSNPNDEAVNDMLGGSVSGPALTVAVILAPVVEEVLFRGVLFGSLRGRSRALAYIVSIAVFGIYHIWQYALSGLDWMLLIYIIRYIPVGYALAWCYEKSNSIWPPIALHMLNNALFTLGV